MTDKRPISPISAILTDGNGDLIIQKGVNVGDYLEYGRAPFLSMSELFSSFPHRLTIGGEHVSLDDLRRLVMEESLVSNELEFMLYQENGLGDVATMSIFPFKLSHHDAIVWIFEWVGAVPQWILSRLPRLGGDPISSVAVVPYSFTRHIDDLSSWGQFNFGPQCFDVFGLTAEEIERDPSALWALVLPEDVDVIRQATKQSIDNLAPFQAHMRMRVGTGIKTVYAETFPCKLNDSVVRWDGVIIDMTAYHRIRAEEIASHQWDVLTARRIGQATERERIVGELHDGLGSMLLELKYRARRDAQASQELRDLVDHTVDELRLIVMAAEHTNQPFVDALTALCERLQGSFFNTEMRFEWAIDVGDRSILTKKRALNCMRIVQELVVNAVKHSKATLVRMTALDLKGGRIQICIEDNGTGLPKKRLHQHGLGLLSVERRARSLNADFQVQTGEAGTKVCVTVQI